VAVAVKSPLATVGVMELAVFTGTAVLILVQPAQEVVSSSRVASLNV